MVYRPAGHIQCARPTSRLTFLLRLCHHATYTRVMYVSIIRTYMVVLHVSAAHHTAPISCFGSAVLKLIVHNSVIRCGHFLCLIAELLLCVSFMGSILWCVLYICI